MTFNSTNTERPIDAASESAISHFLSALVDQNSARVIVEPKRRAEGFWFGGGNMIQSADGTLYLCGRYRNVGDSRTGLAAGERGLELAVFRSADRGETFEQIACFTKKDLSRRRVTTTDSPRDTVIDEAPVLSIEGSCLVPRADGVTLYVSSEKERPYPEEVADYLKPGTGVWSIDEMRGPTVGDLSTDSLSETLRSQDPEFLHVKDPFWATDADGRGLLLFCTHPYNWSSSNTGYLPEKEDGFGPPVYRFFERGSTWDVAISRGTCVLPLPKVGRLAEGPDLSVMFYDGGESLRKLDEHRQANKRPRGYSCEELGGAALLLGGDPARSYRLSRLAPMFVSPWGTGSSRYVDVLVTEDGYYATWEQSQDDGSQPLVMNYVSASDAAALLSGTGRS